MSGKDPLPREQAYEGVRAVNPPDIISSVRAPTVADKKYPLGTMWMDTVARISYQLVAAPGVWAPLGASAGGDLNSLTTPTGVVLPLAGTIDLTEGDNIVISGLGNDVTIGVVESPTFDNINATGDLEVDGGIASVNGSIVADNGSVTANVNVTAATGDITATAGDIVIAGANSILEMSGAGTQIHMNGGAATDFIGTGTLAAGTATILNTQIAANDRIFISRIATNGSTTLGVLTYAINAGVSFVVTSATLGTPGTPQAGDTSTFAYVIIRQI